MHKKISEYQAKSALFDYISSSELIIEVRDFHSINQLPQKYPWLLSTKLVAKPDVGIGNRGKLGLISLKNDWPATRDWIISQWGREITQSSIQPVILNRFIIQEYVPHATDEELYLSIQTEPENDVIILDSNGGINIEDNWQNTSRLKVDLLESLDTSKLEQFINQYHRIHSRDISLLVQFIEKLYTFFIDYAFVELEINPLVIRNGSIHVVDLKAKIDTDALWQNNDLWQQYDFMDFTGLPQSANEQLEKDIREMDFSSGSSLKCKILNPNGSIWPLTAGAGASIVVMDAIAQRGLINEVGFYGEYSGNPDNQLMQSYTELILSFMLAASTDKRKSVLILGATANFTNVKETFVGIVNALKTHTAELKKQNVMVLVRRGGPNQEEGLKYMKTFLDEIGLENEVHNSHLQLTELVWKI